MKGVPMRPSQNNMAARLFFSAVFLLAFVAGTAQDNPVGQVAQSTAGKVGQRQIGNQVVPGIVSGDRINSRITNRVQSRIRNRIDRNYDPQANAVSPFKVAGDQAKIAGQPPRR